MWLVESVIFRYFHHLKKNYWHSSEQDGTFTSTILNDIMEKNDLLLNDDSSNGFTELINEEDSTDKYESITAGITGDLDTEQEKEGRMKMVSKLLRIVET